ncbi:DUF3999 family protein [Azohydromonas caseinilytica]|uniref:DUF3999 domain-containing protein n=1 Tax=Azohydromonas caseinilytica TaxID=2728836 RepID=A0A848F958_9BURK|nr:DUF3999 family protein [Azohydromonas caseinilytica]NML15882.1 DUF3999 domain-containing protein [Azohydromonas caseinilytica]
MKRFHVTRPGLLPATLACAASLAAAQGAEDHPGRYAATAPVTLSGSAGLQRLPLPLAVLQASRSPGWADVRIFNAAGEPVPLAWAGAPAVEPAPVREVALPRFDWPGSVDGGASAPAPLTLRLRADGAVLDVRSSGAASAPAASGVQAWLLDLQPLGAERPAALRLQWPATAQGLERRATVQASRDTQRWEDVGAATLVDVPGPSGAGSAVRQPRIELQGVTREQRYLRLVVRGGDFGLESVQAELAGAQAEAPLASARFPLRPDGERTWRLDAGAVLPVQRLQLHLAEDNAVAPFQLLRRAPLRPTPRGTVDWWPVASLTAYRLQREGRLQEAPPVSLDGGPAREWRLVLDPRAPLPTSAPEATLWWRTPQLVFAARGSGPFTLAVGRDPAPAATLPLPTLLPGWVPGAEHRLPGATAGALVARHVAPRGAVQLLQDATAEQRRRWLLWGLLALAVAVLGALAWRLARDLKRPAPEQPPAP